MIPVLFFILMLLCSFGCVSKEISLSIPVIKENEMIADMSVNAGEILNFKFESNPTTGYQWYVTYDDRILKLAQSQFIESDSGNLVGASGIQYFKFRVIKKGDTRIEFVYKREWEKDTPPLKKIIYNIKVR